MIPSAVMPLAMFSAYQVGVVAVEGVGDTPIDWTRSLGPFAAAVAGVIIMLWRSDRRESESNGQRREDDKILRAKLDERDAKILELTAALAQCQGRMTAVESELDHLRGR